jgi:Fic family protein
VRHRQGRLIGRMEALGFDLRAEAILATLTKDILKSSEIEGEILDKEQVWSSSRTQRFEVAQWVLRLLW